MRKTFIETIINLAETDKNIYLLTGKETRQKIRELRQKFPKSFIKWGLAEQIMLGVAA